MKYGKIIERHFKGVKMNCLNNIILEGNIKNISVNYDTEKGENIIKSDIEVSRFYKDNQTGDIKKEVSVFSFVYSSVWDREKIERLFSIGRGVRIVGYLKQSSFDIMGVKSEKVFIVAQHVEFKPDFRSKKNQETK